MNPMQLRETTLDPNTRRLVQLTIDDEDDQRTDAMMDMLLAKKRLGRSPQLVARERRHGGD